jgi:hypothetical protein
MILRRLVCGPNTVRKKACLAGILVLGLLACTLARADGCFVHPVWNKQKDINEPTQKAIILHDQGREDLVLQVKYEGPADDFGWLVPVPGLPEVRKGSMDCFYELSRLTQAHWGDGQVPLASHGLSRAMGAAKEEAVKVIEIKTVGAYEIAVLSTRNAASLSDWLNAHQFVFPKDKQAILDAYIQKQWYFVAARVNPERNGFTLKSELPKHANISPTTRKQLAKGELHPLVISFPSEKCSFPLAISAVNGKPSEVSLCVLSAEPLMSRVIFEKKFAAYCHAREEWIKQRPEREKADEQHFRRMDEIRAAGMAQFQGWNDDPADPPPASATMRESLGMERFSFRRAESDDDYYPNPDLVRCMEVQGKSLAACSKEMPRLAGKSWWLSKQVQTFAPDEMRDLEFEPPAPVLGQHLGAPGGLGCAHALVQFESRAVPVVLAGLESSDQTERSHAATAMAELQDARLVGLIPALARDTNPRVRAAACQAAAQNWDARFASLLTESLRDPSSEVRVAALESLRRHASDAESQVPVYEQMLAEDGVAAPSAIMLLGSLGHAPFSREQLIHLLSSTNLPVVSTAFTQLRRNLERDELEPLLTNSLSVARLMGLGELTRIGDKAAVDRIVFMLHDPNETVRWRVRSSLRRLSDQKLGADPAAWEKWWAGNRDTFTPQPSDESRAQR